MTRGVGACASPVLLRERCTGCGLCATACPCGAIQLDEKAMPIFACERACTGSADCVACRVGFHPCQAVCDAQAIQFAFAIRLAPKKG